MITKRHTHLESSTWQFDIFAESLLFEIADSEFIGKREEMKYIVFDVIILEHIHEMGAIALNLLFGCHGAEYDFGEALGREHPETDSADRPAVLN